MFPGPENVNILAEFLGESRQIICFLETTILCWAEKQHRIFDFGCEEREELVGIVCLLVCRFPRERNCDIIIQKTEMAYAYAHHALGFPDDFSDIRMHHR